MPDFNNFIGHGIDIVCHSAKGTTWGSHKYIAKKIVNGKVRYIYKSVKSAVDKTQEASGRAVKSTKEVSESEAKINDLEKKISGIEMARDEYSKKAAEVLEEMKNSRSANPRTKTSLMARYKSLTTNIKSMDYQKNNLLQEKAALEKEVRDVKRYNRYMSNK